MPEEPATADGDTPRGSGWLPHGFRLQAHSHADGQLVYAASGILVTTTEGGTWVAPANRVTWTPHGFTHSHRFYGRTDTRVVVVPRPLSGELAGQPVVLTVTPLLREVLLALTDRRQRRPGTEERLRAVLIDELLDAPEQPVHLPEPRDRAPACRHRSPPR